MNNTPICIFSPHSSGSEKLPSKVEEDLRGEESVRRPRTLAEVC